MLPAGSSLRAPVTHRPSRRVSHRHQLDRCRLAPARCESRSRSRAVRSSLTESDSVGRSSSLDVVLALDWSESGFRRRTEHLPRDRRIQRIGVVRCAPWGRAPRPPNSAGQPLRTCELRGASVHAHLPQDFGAMQYWQAQGRTPELPEGSIHCFARWVSVGRPTQSACSRRRPCLRLVHRLCPPSGRSA